MYNLVISELKTLTPGNSQVLIPFLTRRDNSLVRLLRVVEKEIHDTRKDIHYMIYELTSGLPFTISGYVQTNKFPKKKCDAE